MTCRIKCDCLFLKYCASEGDSTNCHLLPHSDWSVTTDPELPGLYSYPSVVWSVPVRGGHRFVREPTV